MPAGGDRPSAAVSRYGPFAQAGTAPALGALSSSAIQYMTMPGVVGDYNSKPQYIDFVCNQNNVMDSDQYIYGVDVYDELGANAVAGNKYFMIDVTYSTITDLRFP